ncbi:MAG: DUF3656 domain-containing protein, partial [Bacillota bacterium]|nr:DUF3656 domain-containing protein [Bacillota bacterium]
LYDRNGLLINSAEKKCYIKVKENLGKGDTVYKTKDINYYRELDGKLDGEFRRFPLVLRIYAYPEARLVIDAEGLGVHYMYESEEILSEARNNPTDIEQVIKQFDRLNETVFRLGHVEFEECNAFIPAKLLNSARREIVNKLYDEKLKSKPRRIREKAEMPTDKQNDEKAISTTGAKAASPYLTASVMRKDQYEACRRAGIECIYFEDMGSDGLAKGNVIRRNQNLYEDKVGELLVGGYGGLYRYKDSNDLVTDYSFNVVNSVSCKILTDLGAKRVTLSYELNKKQIEELIRGYEESTGTRPSLEMIVYGRAPLMFTKYCPLKKMDLCGLCRKNNYAIRDEYGTFPIISHQDCTTTILNGKVLNLLDEMTGLDGIEAFRLAFTTETPEEITRIVEEARGKLEGSNNKVLFNKESDTRGHFNKEIL